MQCMAKKRTRTTPNIEPSEMTLYLSLPSTAPNTTNTSFVDLSECAALMNRRFYRQGLNWAVAGFKIVTAQPTGGASIIGSVTCQKLPSTWVFKNAWVKGMKNWQERLNEAIGEDGEDVKGRFLDFKIYADSDHHNAGFAANLKPLSGDGTQAIPGEYLSAKIRIKNGTGGSVAHEIVGVGDNYPGVSAATSYNAVSLVHGYAASRALPSEADPNTPDDLDSVAGTTPQNWMTALHNADGGNADAFIIEDVSGYDLPPYPFENDGSVLDTHYPGGANQLPSLMIHDLASYGGTTIGGSTYMKGGNFPCGLIRIDHSVPTESIAHNIAIQIDLVPGSHRGYLAEPMGDM